MVRFAGVARTFTMAAGITAVAGLGVRAQTAAKAAPAAAPRPAATAGIVAPDLARVLAGIHASSVRAHVEFLADDLLEGRLPGTRGYDLAARYVAAQLAAIGLAPGGDAAADRRNFFQQVPLIESTLKEASIAFRPATGAATTLTRLDDFMMNGDVHRAKSRVEAPVVFVGFGVTAPELKHDDYAGLDVRGKIVAILTNAPASFPTEQRAHHANPRLKAQVAVAHGAVGLLSLRTPDDERRAPWAKVKAAAPTSAAWLQADGTPAGVPKSIEVAAALSASGAARLFTAAGPGRLDRVFEEAKAGAPKGFDLEVTATLTSHSELRRFSSPNVVGILEGSDPALKQTYVAYSAHLDHVGIGAAVGGDRIYNGAYDNATGTGILIEAARALAGLAPRPRRSLLFVFVTAEEKGLVGSDYFATNPSVPAGSIVANVNVDMPLLLFPLDQVVAFGAENSTLQGAAARAATLAGLTLIPDPLPEENLFVRSDQYSFVRQGVPSLFLVPGFMSSDKSIDGPTLFRQFLGTHYHQPSDDLSLPMDSGSVERFTRANVALGFLIASDAAAPAWKPRNFFGETFAGKGKK